MIESHKHHAFAFTLVEILLAMLISSILILTAHSAYKQALLVFQNAENDRPSSQPARTLFDLFRTELASAYLPPADDQQDSADQPVPFSLAVNTDGSLVFQFFTLNPAWLSAPSSAPPARVTYTLEKSRSSAFRLLRSQQPASAEKILAEISARTIAENLKSFTLEIFDVDQKQWTSSFQTETSLPLLVKITLLFNNQSSPPFSAVFNIPARSTLNS